MHKPNDLIMRVIKTMITLLSTGFFLLSCSDKDGTSRLRIVMVDAPADYDEVNVEVEDILVHVDNDAEEGDEGWESVITDESKGIHNLLDLTNGKEVLLADTEFPTGRLSQIRLVLGDENSLVQDGKIFTLTTPSAQQSGLKLQVNQDLREAFTYNFTLDFDAAKSVVQTGASGKYILKPVIRCLAEENSGAIKGSIALIGDKVLVTAKKDTQEYTTYTDQNGAFLLKALPAGTYKLSFDFPEDELDGTIEEEIEVRTGEVTDIGAQSFAFQQ